MKFSQKELEWVERVHLGDFEYDDLSSKIQDKLYDYFHDEMPYGIQKCRTGDPIVWIMDHLSELILKDKSGNFIGANNEL